MEQRIIVIVGPTATGKTKLSIDVAKSFNGEVINADSTQVYKEANIGTAKITEEEKEGIIHHLIDIIDLNTEYTIYNFQKDGRALIDDILSRGKTPVITGGSGLYIRSLLYDYELEEEVKKDNLYEELTNEELYKKAISIYPSCDIHENNRQRLLRFLNHYERTGNIIKKSNNPKKLYNFTLIGLETDRDTLYDKINSRVDKMFDSGLIEEANSLFKKGSKYINTIIGYKELFKYFDNLISLDEAKEQIKQNSRKYAKRQLTWFKNQEPDIKWFITNYNDFNITTKEVINYLNNNY